MSTALDDLDLASDDAPPPALVFTDAAARKVGELIEGEGNPNLMLRVFVQGGGCSGLQYGFEFDEQLQDGDTCVENLGVQAAGRSDELPVPQRRRDRLPRRPRGRAVRDPQSERHHHLRLRFVVLRLIAAPTS